MITISVEPVADRYDDMMEENQEAGLGDDDGILNVMRLLLITEEWVSPTRSYQGICRVCSLRGYSRLLAEGVGDL